MTTTNGTNGTNGTEDGGSSSSFVFPPILIVFISLQQAIFVVSFFGNALVIFVFSKYLKFQSYTNKFIVSLAVADLCTGLSTGTQIFYFIYPKLSSNKYSCFLRLKIISYTAMTSQLTVAFATFDRYLAICHPHNYAKIITNTKSNVMCIIPWIISFYEFLPFFGLTIWESGSRCSIRFISPDWFYGITSVTIYTISLTTFVMYFLILRTAWRYHNRVKPQQNPQAGSKKLSNDIRSAKVTGIVTLAFSVCWLPYMGFQFRDLASKSDRSRMESDIALWLVFLGILNSVVNPIIYAWKRPDFQKQCKKMLGCT